MGGIRLIGAGLMAATLALATAQQDASAQSAPQDQTASFIGRWTGQLPIRDQQFHAVRYVDVEIRRNASGGIELVDLSPDAGGANARELVVSGNQVATRGEGTRAAGPQLPPWSATLTADGALEAKPLGNGAAEPLRLSHNAAVAARIDNPRLDGKGERVVRYDYSEPSGGGEWPSASLAQNGVDGVAVRRLIESVLAEQRAGSNHTDAILMARNGKLVLEEYFWTFDRDAPHQISSVTKSVTSMIAGAAVDRGKISLDDPVRKYFTDYPATAWLKQAYPTTLRDLLTMRAGLEWQEDVPYADARNSTIAMRQAPNPVAFVLDRPLTSPPGSRYNYNSGLPKLVGAMVQQAVGEPLDRFADQAVFHPLGISNYSWTRQRDGNVETAGGMWLRPRDMLKLGQLMLNGGVWKGAHILSADWVHASTSQQTAAGDYPYGYFWHIFPASHPVGGHTAFMAIGQGGQLILVCPELATVIVVTSSNWGPGGSRVALESVATPLLQAIH